MEIKRLFLSCFPQLLSDFTDCGSLEQSCSQIEQYQDEGIKGNFGILLGTHEKVRNYLTIVQCLPFRANDTKVLIISVSHFVDRSKGC